MLKDNKEYLSEVYEKINNRLKNTEIQNKRKLNFKTITATIASTIVVLGTSLTVYATLGGTIGGKPVLNWFGIDISDRYSEYVVPVENESIETEGAKLSLINTVCDDGLVILEFDLTLSEEAKNKLGVIKKFGSPFVSGETSLVASFNDESGNSPSNHNIQINGKIYDLKSPQRDQQVIKVSDYEYKIQQMYFLTDTELQGQTDFKVTLDNISIVNMNEQKHFKTRVRGYEKEDSTIEDVLKEYGIKKDLETLLAKYPDDITAKEVRAEYYSDYDSVNKVLKELESKEELPKEDYIKIVDYVSTEEYINAIDKIDREMSSERKAERKEIEVLLDLYDYAEGLREKDIIMDGSFNIDLSKNKILRDTKVIPQDSQKATYKKMDITVDKVTVTPMQTIITLTPTIRNANSTTNANDKDYIGIIKYNVYDNKGNLLVNHQFEQKRTVILDNGKTIEGSADYIINNLTFSNATMILTDYITIKTDDNIDSIKIVPCIQEETADYTLDPIIVKLK